MKNNSYLVKAAIATFLLSTALASNAFARFSKEDIKLDTSWLTGSVLEEAEALTKNLKRDITVYSWVDQKNIKKFKDLHLLSVILYVSFLRHVFFFFFLVFLQ